MKILMIANTDGALYNFRKPLIKKLISEGFEVHSISSSKSPEGSYIRLLEKLGVHTHIVEFDNSVGIFDNFSIFSDINKIVKEVSPDIVHSFTHKPAIFGTFSARLNGAKKIFITVTGLGRLFSYDTFKFKVYRKVLLNQYRLACRFSSKVFFQNPDDMDFFIEKKIVKKDRAVLTPGSGIDLEEFSFSKEKIKISKDFLSQELGIDVKNKIIVLFPARALPEKGFFEFYKSAKFISQLTDKYVFIHLGSAYPDAGLDEKKIKYLSVESKVFYLGFKKNIKDYMLASDIVVLPSYYREGIPRSLIEALALDKIIITTNLPGCRETVIDGWNGFFVRERDWRNLTEKILSIDENTIKKFSSRSILLARKYFDSRILVNLTLKEYLG
ncbi:N,N'-diacetylbacillosaminyl-diphospho-undecaprenol alpha-1,3-N-acetylgalactosaminyltransferase [Persephonella hydrogeniphila]|uniref:N,N'-diacetylbacillosaminyl-diphospho-undecaprenol alpha-1,3-N-acetylgalactosaminyltransferase n=1 Tax=Persephonella hydrogeniphila TaxID=198703 RepID=A0A285N9Q3_9AQUI|nr:glycosyltransferase family 4 protein [Persephonella hydrogeniphila]SNZ06160.1 N,N'-diacetylbacillosaminyl-diphospho-undecaprenol alpha-1,3-N-acetylgalactosaminyltransferase [Persephonella hydrogeniphila]